MVTGHPSHAANVLESCSKDQKESQLLGVTWSREMWKKSNVFFFFGGGFSREKKIMAPSREMWNVF